MENIKLLQDVLSNADDPRIRAAAVRVLSHWGERIPDAWRMKILNALVSDEHPRVRLEAIRALGQIKSGTSANIALKALDKPMDRFLDYGLWLTMNDLAEPLLLLQEY